MENLTRRGILLSGSALLPLAAMPSALLGETRSSLASPTIRRKQKQMVNLDFMNYTAEALARGTAKRKTGVATAGDYKSLPQNLQLLASHFEDTGVDAGFKDPRFKQWATSTETQAAIAKSKIRALSPDAFAGVKKYAPSLTEYDFCVDPTDVYTPEQINHGLNILSTHGIAHYLRVGADMFHSDAPDASSVRPVEFNRNHSPVLQYPNYVVGTTPLFKTASNGWCNQKYKKSDVCQFLVAVGAALAGTDLGVGCLILAAIFAPAGLAIGIGCAVGAGLIALTSAYLALNCTAE